MSKTFFKRRERFNKDTIYREVIRDGRVVVQYYNPPPKPKRLRGIPKMRRYAYPYPNN